MSAVTITFTVDGDDLPRWNDDHLARLWHIAQANPAPFGDLEACRLAEKIGREIIRRWLMNRMPELWNHQGLHAAANRLEAARAAQGKLAAALQRLISGAAQDREGAPNTVDLFDAKALLDELSEKASA